MKQKDLMTSCLMAYRRSRRCVQTKKAPEKLEPKEGIQLQELGEVVTLRLGTIAGESREMLEKGSSLEVTVEGGQRIVSEGLENVWREVGVSEFGNG